MSIYKTIFKTKCNSVVIWFSIMIKNPNVENPFHEIEVTVPHNLMLQQESVN